MTQLEIKWHRRWLLLGTSWGALRTRWYRQTITKPVAGSVWDVVVASYRDRPVAFVQDLLVKGTPGFVIEDWQKRFLKAVARGERRIRCGRVTAWAKSAAAPGR